MVVADKANFRSAARRSDSVKEFDIGFVVVGPLCWQVVFVVNRLNRANWLASSAVHTLIRVNVKHAIALVDAVDWAFFNASFVFDINARKRNYVSHDFSLSAFSLTVASGASAPRTRVESRKKHDDRTDDY